MQRLILATLIMALATTASASNAIPIIIFLFSNGNPDYYAGLGVTMQSVADDFELSTGEYPANSASFTLQDTNCAFPAAWEGVLRWWIYLDDGGGLPGAVVASGWAPEVDWSAGPDNCATGSVRFFRLWFPFGRSVDLTPGTRYWLAWHMARTWDWHLAPYLHVGDAETPRLNSAVSRDTASSAWEVWDHDIAFALTYDSSYGYIFYDGLESMDTSLWSAAH